MKQKDLISLQKPYIPWEDSSLGFPMLKKLVQAWPLKENDDEGNPKAEIESTVSKSVIHVSAGGLMDSWTASSRVVARACRK